MSTIDSFMDLNHEGHGWVVKAPYTTNSMGVKFCSSRDDVYASIRILADAFGDRIDYLMLQPRLKNSKEYKVVLLIGTAKYISNPARKAVSLPSFCLRFYLTYFLSRLYMLACHCVKGKSRSFVCDSAELLVLLNWP